MDGSSVRAVFWGARTGPNPTDRSKLGSKRHLICDGRGVPLAIQLTGANRNDSQQALALVEAIPPLQGKQGRPRHRPDCVVGDRGYDAEAISGKVCVPATSFLGSQSATLSTEAGWGDGDGCGTDFAWLNQFRRLRIRYEKRADIHEAFLVLGCVLICWNFLAYEEI